MIDTSQFNGKKIVFQTLGCKLNFAETSAIGRSLLEAGFQRAKIGEEADICIVNTCSVTDTADKKCRQAIHKLINRHPNALMIVTGCYAQLKPDEIAAIPGVDLVLGANEKGSITDFIALLDEKQTSEVHTVKTADIRQFTPICSADDRTRHFLKVQDGCDYYCTYCTIPLARGRSRNASIIETVAVAQKAIDEGAREIVLTGVNTGDFGRSTNETFFDLLKALDQLEHVRYRISSIEPNLLTDEIINYVALSKQITPHFHIPLQSGSNAILELMHRRYTRELFAEKIHKIKSLMPQAFIGVDVMVGVRGETPEHFEETRSFLESLPISQLHVFTYSERAGTKALDIAYNVPKIERKKRNDILHQLSEQKTEEFYQSQIGREGVVLWEAVKSGDTMHGFTENYVRVEAPYNKALINTLQKVNI
ncbi:MAG: tRNA (N(6)-L-threonylcarbamoyladenosine(37)-C(2))-methylthiotransferase MtaB [Paludibacteraceae bacterium]|nr:tRNA (N(6)-L-threonylcarbamoyladenosine(37)-C(2))-methylthiotransferase MtaB [Paludibacteraceae bacterium]